MKLGVRDKTNTIGGGAPTNCYGRRRSANPTAAFTLIEIAICLGVIAFALVAIIGILPAGLQVQRDNREDTIINQEGTYLLEAIKSGAEGLEDFAKRVDLIVVTNVTQAKEEFRFDRNDNLDPRDVIGLLSTPSEKGDDIIEVRAVIAAGAGAITDMKTDLAFTYQVIIRNFAYTNSSHWESAKFQQALADRTRDVRVDARWPMLADGKPGIGRQNFRSLMSGRLVIDGRLRGGRDLWFLRQ
jgi:type II secretory pathway pseudopilin PulG